MGKTVNILKLKPTQFAVGMLEVDLRINKLAKIRKSKVRSLAAESPIPVIVSPKGNLYILDHHHLLFVFYHLGIKKVRIKIVMDLRAAKMSYFKFWRWMCHHSYYYPYCQFGEGPRKPLYLPRDIRGLADDPYRGLAWVVRKIGAYKNNGNKFAEFKWANFFRSKGLLDRHGLMKLPHALKKAVSLAQSRSARKLPGYIGPIHNHKKIRKNIKRLLEKLEDVLTV